jgi:beta-lactamase superfamily II metal-dependent hydrolase
VQRNRAPAMIAHLEVRSLVANLEHASSPKRTQYKPQLACQRQAAIIVEAGKTAATEVADYVDRSVYNLSSIVVLAEIDGKRIVLTGDGRGDYALAGIKEKGSLDANGKIEVDILKLPHHASERDVRIDYFQSIHQTLRNLRQRQI